MLITHQKKHEQQAKTVVEQDNKAKGDTEVSEEMLLNESFELEDDDPAMSEETFMDDSESSKNVVEDAQEKNKTSSDGMFVFVNLY